MRIVVAAVAAVCAAASLWAAGMFSSAQSSSPDFVSSDCRSRTNVRACTIALRYLAALDLDRAQEACGLLESSTLAAAGGMVGCTKTLLRARGIRIHYSISRVLHSPLGRTVRFSTLGDGDAPIRQQMLISPAGRIVAVVPEP
jgi:hypothetical protein